MLHSVSSSIRARYFPEQRTLGIVAIATIVLFATDVILRGYVHDFSAAIAWWRFATPMFGALVGIMVLLGLILTRGTTHSEIPVVPTARRTWTTFGPRLGIIAASVTMIALVATTLAAGFASSTDGEGRYAWLVIPIPNEPEVDPIRVPFYGWAYGVPVLVCLVALAAVTWAVLHSNAARPYIRPETVAAEQDARRVVAGGAVRIATAAMLLALGGAWRLIARGGSVSSLEIMGVNDGDPFDASWRYAELAVAAGWAAPVLEILGFVLLVLAARLLWRRAGSRTPEGSAERASAAASR